WTLARCMMDSMRLLSIFLVLVLLIVGVLFGISYKRWEGQPPTIQLDHDFKALGRAPSLNVTIQDEGTGLKNVLIRLKQKDQDVVLADDSFPGVGSEKSRTYDLGKLIAEKAKVQPGPASLNVEVSDHSFRNLMKGNQAQV